MFQAIEKSTLKRRLVCSAVTALVALCAASIQAEEGLWTFDHFPSQKVKALYGVTVDQVWLDHVERSAVRLSNGCSAALVSAAGLVLTDNHCVTECAQDLSSAGNDSFTNGFISKDKLQERRCTHLTADVILRQSDVTQKVLQAGAGLSGAPQLQAQAEVIRNIEASACANGSGVRCQVSGFYSGAQYKLFKYRRFDDVRLAFSPGTIMSTFGDADTVPRRLDVAFLRIYDNDRPAITQEHLRWSGTAPRAGELVFIAGSPRVSERQLTVSQLQTERDMALPVEIRQRDELNRRLARFDEESTGNRSAGEYALSDSTNHTEYLKLLEKALLHGGFIDRKLQEEEELRKESSTMQTQLSLIAHAEQVRREQALAHQFLVTGPFFDASSSQLFSYARTLVRGALERAKPSSERSPSYADSELGAKERQLFAERTVYLPLEQLILKFWLDEAQQSLPTNDAVLKLLLDGHKPQKLSEDLSQSRLGDLALRKRLWEGGLSTIQSCDDPMIRYVLRLEPVAQALDAKWQDTVTGPEGRAAAAIATTRLQVDPNSVYPDANLTLRLSYGKIDGFDDQGRHIGPFTTVSDLYKGGELNDPTIDPRWTAAKGRLDGRTVLNIFTTNDGINGNSGSPLLNAQGEVVGVFYGGNSYASAGDYGYDSKHNRAVAVAAVTITDALFYVYGAENLVIELTKVSE